jgi:hypothetical protein
VALPGGNRSRRAGYDQKMSLAASFRRELEIVARFSDVLRTRSQIKWRTTETATQGPSHPSNYTLRTLCKELQDCGLGFPRRASKPRRISRT